MFHSVLLAIFLLAAQNADEMAYRLVFKGGATTFLVSAPEVKGNRLQGKLLETGALVSFKREEVDLGKSGPAPRPEKASKSKKTAAPLKTTREDAEKALSSLSRTGTVETLPERSEAGEKRLAMRDSNAAKQASSESDDAAEAYWRGRARDVLEQKKAAAERLNAAIEARDYWDREGWPMGSPEWAYELSLRRDRVTEAERRVAEIEKKYEALLEEGRKAGALPGWLR